MDGLGVGWKPLLDHKERDTPFLLVENQHLLTDVSFYFSRR